MDKAACDAPNRPQGSPKAVPSALAPDWQVQAALVPVTAAGNRSVAMGGKGSGTTVIIAEGNKVERAMTQASGV
ncbi:MAG: hypothetical protein ACUVWA_15250 [Candidatus Oleimicrobiaceae bacterium]